MKLLRRPESFLRRSVLHRVIAGAGVAALLSLAIAPTAAIAEPVQLLQASTATSELLLTRSSTADPGGYFWDNQLTATISNKSDHVVSYGLGATAWQPNIVERLWQSSWSSFAGATQTTLQPHTSVDVPIPEWPGVGLYFYEDIFGQELLMGQWRSPLEFVPVQFSGSDNWTLQTMQIGRVVSVTPGLARAGETIGIRTQDLNSGVTQVPIRLLPEADLLDGLAVNEGIDLGTAAVTSGAVATTVALPPDLPTGPYAVLLGPRSDGLWAAGPALVGSESSTFHNLVIEAGAPRGSTSPGTLGTPVSVTPVDPQTGTAPVQFTFSNVTVPGTTSVSTTTVLPANVPAPTTFTLLSNPTLFNPPLYYDLHTSAFFSGSVKVCFSFNTTGMTDAVALAQHVYHYNTVVSQWEDITVLPTTTAGTVCGVTNSFSTFAIGTPVIWPFEGFLSPVDNNSVLNMTKAGSAVPVKFRLGGDRGLNILAANSPSSKKVTCSTTAVVDELETTATASVSSLQYGANTYTYVWKTDKSWVGTCRMFVLTLTDGTVHTALFKFK